MTAALPQRAVLHQQRKSGMFGLSDVDAVLQMDGFVVAKGVDENLRVRQPGIYVDPSTWLVEVLSEL
jgi:hypothetical protein